MRTGFCLKALVISITVLTVLVLVAGYRFSSYPDLSAYNSHIREPLPSACIDENGKNKSLTLRFLGTSSLVISDGETSIMTDGFMTRPGIAHLLFGRLMPDRALITKILTANSIDRLDALVSLHSHHDHSMDAPEVAMQTGALLIGSASTANIGLGWGLANDRIKIAVVGVPMQFGQFSLTLVLAKHTPMPAPIAWLTGIGEHIDRPMTFPAPLHAFKEGDNYSLLLSHPLGNIAIHGSTGYLEPSLADYRAEVIFLGIAGLGGQSLAYQEAYFENTVTALGASRIIPIHWDDFTKPLTSPLRPMNLAMDSVDKAMAFIHDKVEADPKLTLELVHNSDEICLF